MPCLKDEEFMTIDKLMHEKLDQLTKWKISPAEEKKHLLSVRHKLIQLKCTASRYED